MSIENLDADNSKDISFNVSHGNDKDYKNVNFNYSGTIKRNSHSNYIGIGYESDDGKIKYTHFTHYAPPKCYVKKSNISEHGIFAAMNFKPGDLIEEAKIILLDSTTETCKDWVLMRYAMVWDCNCDICKANGKTLFIPVGNVMLYNHSQFPNAFYTIEKPLRKIQIIAATDIQKDEEITFHYGEDYASQHKKIINTHSAASIPEDARVALPGLNDIPCSNCLQNQNGMFRSMIVPEKLL